MTGNRRLRVCRAESSLRSSDTRTAAFFTFFLFPISVLRAVGISTCRQADPVRANGLILTVLKNVMRCHCENSVSPQWSDEKPETLRKQNLRSIDSRGDDYSWRRLFLVLYCSLLDGEASLVVLHILVESFDCLWIRLDFLS